MNIFAPDFLYTAYTDDTTFVLKDQISVFKILNIFHKFSLVFGQKPDTAKCEIDGIVTLKGVNVELYDMKRLNIMKKL